MTRQFNGQVSRHQCVVNEERLVDSHALTSREKSHLLEKKGSDISAMHTLSLSRFQADQPSRPRTTSDSSSPLFTAPVKT
jgi:hypothetical protein